MNRTTSLPHDWPEIEAQVRDTIIAMGSILQRFGPRDNDKTVTAFLGQKVKIVEKGWMSQEEISGIDITRHALYDHARAAWCYAYQLDGWEDFTIEHLHEISCGLLSGGYALTDSESEHTGLDWRNDMPLRRVFETAIARWNWTHDESDLTVRELALLSNMAETTVRSSLSKEGFRLEPPNSTNEEKSSYKLSANDALQWLSRRRGFIPNRSGVSADRQRIAIDETLADISIPFPTALRRMTELAGLSAPNDLGVRPEWYAGLIEGEKVILDVDALIALADILEVPRADFAARGVRHILEMAEN